MIISPKLSATSRRHNGLSGSKRAELSAEGLRVLTAWTPRERSRVLEANLKVLQEHARWLRA